MVGIYIFYIIICKFYYEQEFCLVILFLVNKYLEIGLDNNILLLSLVI